jgi:hypothetical protein
MSTAITGNTVATITLNTISGQLLCTASCLSPDESTIYWIGRAGFSEAGAVYKCPMSSFATGSVTQLYAPGFMGTGSVAMWQNGTKIYSLESTGTSRILSANADGSSVSATVEWSSFSFASGFLAVYPENPYAYSAMGSFRYVSQWDVDNEVSAQALNATWFLAGIGPCRFQANSMLVGHDQPGYILVWDRNTGHMRTLCGNGSSTALSAGGNAFDISISTPKWLHSDEDGRVYFLTNSRIWSLINGVVAQIGASSTNDTLLHSFSTNRLIRGGGNSYDWVLMS